MPWWGSNKPKLLETAEFSIIEDITITPHEIGRGSYGTVYAALYDGKPCVAKEMHPYLNQPHQGRHNNVSTPLEIFFKEINTLSTLKHPSIVQFLGVYFRDKSHVPILVMERMWMNLFTLLEERPNQLPLLIKTHILYDVACGLQYLHGQKKPVVHRDLSANNVLLTENLEAKIADLGQAKALDKIAGQKFSTAPGNLAHMAPETLKHKPTYDSKLDVFSFGCTIIHTVTEEFPTPTDQYLQSMDAPNTFTMISEFDRRKEFIDKMASSSSLLQQIAVQCLQDASSSRPSAPEICEELKKYINKLEIESEVVSKQYKEVKLSLVRLLQSQESKLEKKKKLIDELNQEKSRNDDYVAKKEEYITELESRLQDTKSKFEQIQMTSFGLEREKESLRKDLAKQDEINKQLNTTYVGQVDRLRGDVKAQREEIKAADLKCAALQQEVEVLQAKLKDEQRYHSQEKQKVINLENQLQSISSMAESHKKELIVAKTDLSREKDNYKLQLAEMQHRLETEYKNDTEALKEKCAEKDVVIVQLEKKLEEQEGNLKGAVHNLSVYQDYKLKYTELSQKYEELKQVNQKRQQEVVQPVHQVKSVTDPGSRLYQQLLELQQINEAKHQQLQQQQMTYSDTFKLHHEKVAAVHAQMSDLKKKSVVQKQQLEEKSYRLSTLESSLNELQESFYSREEKLKSLEEDNTILHKLVENNDKLQRNLQSDLISKEESLKRKDEELQLLKKEHADELNELHLKYTRQLDGLSKDVEMYKSRTAGQGEVSTLLKEEAQCKADLAKKSEEKFKKLDNELRSSAKAQKLLKRQIKHQEVSIKEKMKYIEQLEKKSCDGRSSQYYFNVHWFPYVSLPVKRFRPNAVTIKDKVFLTGGYQKVGPQGRELHSYLKSLERGNEVFCFHTGKCRCDSIASPVVLGGVASVNGQCVLVSGAEGNTLTGNVYVLCEEGSDEQWKKFSEPVPTPRILPCVCCYGERWMIVCGGYACKEGSNLLEAVNVVEIFDITKGEWYKLSEKHCPKVSSVLCCGVVSQDVYVIGDGKILSSNSNKLITTSAKTSESNLPLWSEVDIYVEELSKLCQPFSVVDVNGDPMIIASISGSEDDVTCVLMKDTTDTWRKMSEAVECQHCSAVVVTPTLELLLFGGSEKMSAEGASDMSQKGTLIPTFSLYDNLPMLEVSKKPTSSENNNTLVPQDNILEDVPVSINQPPAISFTGPIHTKQFDHKGGTFQSPVHKVSIVVPPNAIDDGEKVTVYMGATTSGPFDLPEDCKLRSAVVWLGSGSDVVLKRSIAVVVPHSAVFTSPQHHSMMRFLVCEDCEGPRYKFRYSMNHFDIDTERGWIELSKFVMVAVVAGPDFSLDDEGVHSEEEYGSDDDEFHDTLEDISLSSLKVHRQRSSPKGKTLRMPPVRYLAKLFWPRGQILNSFRVDVYYLQNLPTELYKVNTLYRKAYYEDNGAYPEIVGTEFMVDGDGTELKCVLPCSGSSECDCLSGWSVTRMNDISEVSIGKDTCNYKDDPMKFSFKFDCTQAKANLICCFEFRGADRIMNNAVDQVPDCLQKRYHPPDNAVPFVLQKLIHYEETAVEQQHYTHEMNGHEMNAQEEEGPVMDSHQIKNLL
ncbi:uncharacterized protein [Dysidea avara]|uniref:uncharacterized protein isoform X2 n=1 Tax=Dysidea avara TaxID=196820 RepID=UPI003328B4E5